MSASVSAEVGRSERRRRRWRRRQLSAAAAAAETHFTWRLSPVRRPDRCASARGICSSNMRLGLQPSRSAGGARAYRLLLCAAALSSASASLTSERRLWAPIPSHSHSHSRRLKWEHTERVRALRGSHRSSDSRAPDESESQEKGNAGSVGRVSLTFALLGRGKARVCAGLSIGRVKCANSKPTASQPEQVLADFVRLKITRSSRCATSFKPNRRRLRVVRLLASPLRTRTLRAPIPRPEVGALIYLL